MIILQWQWVHVAKYVANSDIVKYVVKYVANLDVGFSDVANSDVATSDVATSDVINLIIYP